MRESFGGAFIIKLLLVFIVFYVSFMAIALNYAKAFRVKNRMINILEQNQYHINNVSDDMAVINLIIEPELKSFGYDYSKNEKVTNDCKAYDNSKKTPRGVCIVPLGSDDARYYTVITYIAIDFPFFNISMVIPISGETKMIYTS